MEQRDYDNERSERGSIKKKEEEGIIEILGIAVGAMGMRLDDFCALHFDEFESCYKAWSDRRDVEARGEWERMRTLATITIQPHCKNRLTPEKLLPLPWDGIKNAQSWVVEPSTAARFAELVGG